MLILESEACVAAEEDENTNSPLSLSVSYSVTPLNPRITPVKVVAVLPVYVKISSSILKRPYSSGNPFVLLTFTVKGSFAVPPLIVLIPTERIEVSVITSGVKLSNFVY